MVLGIIRLIRGDLERVDDVRDYKEEATNGVKHE